MAVEEKLLVIADEVYQSNIWKKGASFSSFKKVRLPCHDRRVQYLRPHLTLPLSYTGWVWGWAFLSALPVSSLIQTVFFLFCDV